MSLIKRVLNQDRPTKIIIGASSQSYPGWIQTQREELDMLKREDWERRFKNRKLDAILAEMVWEHLTEEEGRTAAKHCYDFLKPGGYIRCSVPDGNFRNEAYQKLVQVEVQVQWIILQLDIRLSITISPLKQFFKV